MKHSRTAYVILGMLSIEPNKSGYDIRKAVETSVGSFWGESYGQIYPAIKELVAQGLIEPSESANSKQRRQEYSLTEAGHVCLREWLALPFVNDPPRNEFLLKLFFGREAPPGVSKAHILELQKRNQLMLDSLTQIEAFATANPSPTNPHQPYWMLTLSLGIALTRAALDWGESALVTISSLERSEGKHS